MYLVPLKMEGAPIDPIELDWPQDSERFKAHCREFFAETDRRGIDMTDHPNYELRKK